MEISVWQGQETGSSSVWLELSNETGIEMWVPFLKGLTFDQRGHRDPRHLCPLPPGLSLPPNWPPPRQRDVGHGPQVPSSQAPYSKSKSSQTVRQDPSGIFRLSWRF